MATNVPYLTSTKQGEVLREFCKAYYPDAKADLATVFLERCLGLASPGGSCAVVMPQNWLFLGSYRALRERLLRDETWNAVAKLGPAAFQGMNWWAANTALLILTRRSPDSANTIAGLDASATRVPSEKARLLRDEPLRVVAQSDELRSPDARITLEIHEIVALLETIAYPYKGISPADIVRFTRVFWGMPRLPDDGVFQQSTVSRSVPFGGKERCLWLREIQENRDGLEGIAIRGRSAWGKWGVVVSKMGSLPVTLGTGECIDANAHLIVPYDPAHLPALWAFCQSPEFARSVRQIDRKTDVTNSTLGKVPFDLVHWQAVANDLEPLPEPYSDDPTQWLFTGNPIGSTDPLQVAVARLLGYCWPKQGPDALGAYADRDGIVCLPPVAGEPPAAERFRVLLAAAYGDEWSQAQQGRLLAAVGFAGKGLDEWLRDGFFEQHCRLFQNRPFIWQVWDGRKDGFSALVNYHRLDANGLNRLIYTYLGAWITAQRADRDAGVPGAEGRLVAALDLQKKLEAIRDGEPPYDIYVRWKPLRLQPIGWNPDLNDGVRLNIRPFVTAGVLRSRFTINWNKDRGTNPDGSERLNDLHFTNAEKQAARKAAGVGG